MLRNCELSERVVVMLSAGDKTGAFTSTFDP